MPSTEEVIRNACELFVQNTKKYLNMQLDGSWVSLLTVGLAMTQYHDIYKKAVAAGKPHQDKFAKEVAAQAAGYISTIFVKLQQAQVAVTNKGLVMTLRGVEVPLGNLLYEEVVTGKPNSLTLISRIDEINRKNQQTEAVDAGNLEEEARKAAEVAVQDVKAMLKVELDYGRESLAQVDRALQRLKAMAEISPEHKDKLIRASCQKYGAYIGEVLVRQLGGKWNRVRRGESVFNVVGLGPTNAGPELIVEAILRGKSLDMGAASSASTVVDFVAKAEHASKTSTAEGLFENLDTPGEVPKRIPRFVEEARRIAKVNHSTELDGTLFSLGALDEVIAKERQRLESERSVLTEENFTRARAFSVLPLGIYLGEAIIGTHGGNWEEVPGQSWMRIRQHMIKLDPLTVVSALTRGETATATDKLNVSNAQQYYQGVRPMLHDVVRSKAYGAAGTEENLLAQMGPNTQLNRTVLHFTEACLVFSYSSRSVQLDFSEGSLKEVDTILEEFHKDLRGQLAKSPGIRREDLVSWYGCYAGEVFRRALGGVWSDDASSSINAQRLVHLNINGNRVNVVTKIHKYLESGSGDSVAFLLQGVRSMMEGRLKEQSTRPS